MVRVLLPMLTGQMRVSTRLPHRLPPPCPKLLLRCCFGGAGLESGVPAHAKSSWRRQPSDPRPRGFEQPFCSCPHERRPAAFSPRSQAPLLTPPPSLVFSNSSLALCLRFFTPVLACKGPSTSHIPRLPAELPLNLQPPNPRPPARAAVGCPRRDSRLKDALALQAGFTGLAIMTSSFSSCSCPAEVQRPKVAITGLSHHGRCRLRQSCRRPISRSARPAPGFPAFRPQLVSILLALLLCCACASAAGTQADRQRLRSLARRASLKIDWDRSAPPPWMPQLGRRQTGDDASASSAVPTTLVATRTSGAASATALVVDTGSTSTSIPQPFDTSLGSNFTSPSCPNFFNSFLENSTFVDCVPLSLLLQVCGLPCHLHSRRSH